MTVDQTPSSSSDHRVGNVSDIEYDAFLARLRARFAANTDEGTRPLFRVAAPDLFELWLSAFPPEDRQFHNCHACHSFLKHYGALVVIDTEGRVAPAIWDPVDAPGPYRPAVEAVHRVVQHGAVLSPFYTTNKVWGLPETGIWRHMAIVPPLRVLRPTGSITSPNQAMAERHEDFANLSRALSAYNLPTLKTAVQLLEREQLYRSEKVLGVAQWLLKLKVDQVEHAHDIRVRRNKLWLAVAEAPPGFCHPRSSMIGTLLDDLQAGSPFEACAERFAAKMHPLKYQRPQTPPKAGNIAQAEKTFEALGLGRALERRYAKLEDLVPLWLPAPKPAVKNPGKLFGHLQPKGATESTKLVTGVTTITWEKFSRTVLTTAEEIYCIVPQHGYFTALVTAVHPDAPPIVQWDEPEARNPVTWYVYHGGSLASAWNLHVGERVRVPMITAQPSMWAGPERYPHHGKGVIFVLEGCHDRRTADLCLFPEFLRAELHYVRATIEAYSKSRHLVGEEGATACGLRLQHGSGRAAGSDRGLGATIEVITDGHVAHYLIGRWD